jgi:hypothetical protein
MSPAVVADHAKHITFVRGDTGATAPVIQSALVAVRKVKAWADAQEAALIRQLSDVAVFPEEAIAESSKCSLAHASRSKERSDTLTETPGLASALDQGDITARHVDAVTRVSKRLDSDEQRKELFERLDDLVDVAVAATAEQFEKRIKLEIKRIQADDGEERLIRQRRNVRLSTWTDDEGMWNLRGRFDPVTGVTLAAKLDHALQTHFAEQTPELCPTDPIEKQRFLAAHTLARLVQGDTASGRGTGRPEYVVVIDADADDQPGPVAEWPIPVEIPTRVLAELAADADVHGVVVRNGVVLHAPGKLELGRSTRLANRAQRRALRALYSGCAIPGCTVAYDRCRLHHIVWWRHGGRTDLDNLLPVCSVHHAKIHHDNWTITLGARRELTIRFGDGTVRTTGPPHRNAA